MPFSERVAALVASIPPGRVMTYGLVAEVLADEQTASGARPRGGARQVGHVLATSGADVPWWRVVTAAGRVPQHLEERALERLRAEGVPLRPDGRVKVSDVVWWPSV